MPWIAFVGLFFLYVLSLITLGLTGWPWLNLSSVILAVVLIIYVSVNLFFANNKFLAAVTIVGTVMAIISFPDPVLGKSLTDEKGLLFEAARYFQSITRQIEGQMEDILAQIVPPIAFLISLLNLVLSQFRRNHR